VEDLPLCSSCYETIYLYSPFSLYEEKKHLPGFLRALRRESHAEAGAGGCKKRAGLEMR